MHRQPQFSPDMKASRCLSGCPVPQDHTGTSDDAPPRDWSHLGRRVLAEAWRRLMDEHTARQAVRATPVVPAPHPGLSPIKGAK